MHRKAVFALAGVFLAVAIIVPTVLLFLQAENQLIVLQNPTGMVTNGNSTTTVPSLTQLQESFVNTLIIVAIIDVVFGALFVVTMWYGIHHVHPTH